jgi:hypothetical protein
LQQALVVSQYVESQAVESTDTFVESVVVVESVEAPQETKTKANANIKNKFFISF